MLKLGYIIAKIKEKIWCNHEILYDYYRRGGNNRIGMFIVFISDDQGAIFNLYW